MTDKIHGPRPTGLDPKVFEKNMMQVGRQQESLSKKEQDRLTSAKEAKENDVALQSQDRVDLTRRGEKAAEQTGLLPNLHTLKDKKAGKTTSPVIAEPAKPPVTSAPATETPEMSAPAGATPALGGPATETQARLLRELLPRIPALPRHPVECPARLQVRPTPPPTRPTGPSQFRMISTMPSRFICRWRPIARSG